MKSNHLLSLIFVVILYSCELKDDFTPLNNQLKIQNEIDYSEQLTDVILSPDGYLLFKNQESYNKICEYLDRMTDEEFLAWERNLGFISAQTFLSSINERIEKLKTIEEYNALKQEFSDKLIFEGDNSVRLPFYATAWDRVLTVDGVMKIGNRLFKFERNRELIILDGEKSELTDIESLIKNEERVSVFYPLKNADNFNLKSLIWGELLGNTILSNDGISRLYYSLQLISFNYKGYGVTNPPVYYTEAGFQFKLDIQQQRKGLFGWYNNQTMYYFHNTSHHIEYYQPEHWVNLYVNNVFVGRKKYGGEHIVDIQSFPDAEWGETKYGCTYTFHYYYFVDEYDWSFVEPQIFNFQCTFCSRGVPTEKTIYYSNI